MRSFPKAPFGSAFALLLKLDRQLFDVIVGFLFSQRHFSHDRLVFLLNQNMPLMPTSNQNVVGPGPE